MKSTILVVDDEPAQRQFLSGSLAREYGVGPRQTASEAAQLLAHHGIRPGDHQ